MKKSLLLLAVVLILSGCGGKQAGVDSSPSPAPPEQPGVTQQAAMDTAQPIAEQKTDSVQSGTVATGSASIAAAPARTDTAAVATGGTAQNGVQTPEVPQAVVPTPDPSSAPVAEASPEPSSSPNAEQTVTVSVKDDEGNAILSACAVAFTQGDTILDVLIRVGKQKSISVVYSGKKSSGYVEGIGNLFEFDKGPESGWMYSVNGKFGGKSSGSVKAAQGDVIEWRYTTKLGRDLGQTE